MKKLSLLLSLVLFILTASAQKIKSSRQVTNHSIYVLGNNFEGAIFSAHYTYRGAPDEFTSNNRFTPTNAEINAAEEILQTQLGNGQNRKSDRYDVSQHLNKYYRQYLGYTDKSGKRIIYVNGFINHEYYPLKQAHNGNKILNIPNWYNEVIVTFGGGLSFWRATINLADGKLAGFEINGPK